MDTKTMLNIEVRKDGSFIENREVAAGTLLSELAVDYDTEKNIRILIAKKENQIKELRDSIEKDGVIDFLTLRDPEGLRAMERALIFVFIRATCELTGVDTVVKVEHSLDKGIYCEVDAYRGWINKDVVAKIEERMHEIIVADDKFEKFKMNIENAKACLATQYDKAKLELLKYRTRDTVNVYRCGWLWDYLFGPLPMSTGTLEIKFELKLLDDGGVLIRTPIPGKPLEMEKFVHDRMLSEVFRESHHWLDLIGVPYVAQLNKTIENGNYRRVIQVAEALHEKKIAQIADNIAQLKKRIILIAGPSSSGKTSFAQRLSVQLNVHGIRVCALSTDDYFIDREFVEKDEKGDYKFEDLEAVDVKLFNEQLNMLLEGKEVDVPIYNFIEGKKIFGERFVKLEENDTIIIEGIHGLNDKLTPDIKPKDKFKIYISPLTSLGVDAHNRIKTTDARFYRRLVRDYYTRGKNANASIASWPSVRAGEEKNIFPFQEEADVMFNSALPYELAVLKKYAEPLLKEVKPEDKEYPDALRLLKMLSFFLDLPDESTILNNSLLKEFIGGSCLF